MAREGCSQICFVCGAQGATYALQTRATKDGAYFPFLQSHTCPKGASLPNADGSIDSCFVCYAFLMQQWQSYEQSKTSPLKRLYWLKRIDNGPYIGANMAQQGEYAAALLGIQLNCRVNGNDYQEMERESIKSENASMNTTHSEQPVPAKLSGHDSCENQFFPNLHKDKIANSKPLNHKSCKSPDTPRKSSPPPFLRKTDVLNVPNPQNIPVLIPNKSAVFVCFICGSKCPIKMKHFVCSQKSSNRKYKLAFFCFLKNLKPAMGSSQLDDTGRAEVCDDCYKALMEQWQVLESSGVPDDLRRYVIGSTVFGNSSGVGRKSSTSTKTMLDCPDSFSPVTSNDILDNKRYKESDNKITDKYQDGNQSKLLSSIDRKACKTKPLHVTTDNSFDSAVKNFLPENLNQLISQNVHNDFFQSYLSSLNSNLYWQALPYASLLNLQSQFLISSMQNAGGANLTDTNSLRSKGINPLGNNSSSSRTCSTSDRMSDNSLLSPAIDIMSGERNCCAICYAKTDIKADWELIEINRVEVESCCLLSSVLIDTKRCQVCPFCFLTIKCYMLSKDGKLSLEKKEKMRMPEFCICMRCCKWFSRDQVTFRSYNDYSDVVQMTEFQDILRLARGVLVCKGCKEETDLKPLQLLANLATKVCN